MTNSNEDYVFVVNALTFVAFKYEPETIIEQY